MSTSGDVPRAAGRPYFARVRDRVARFLGSGYGWLLLLSVVGLFYIEPLWLIRSEFGSDGASYFSHAATVGLDFDLDYSNEPVILWNRDRTVAGGSYGAGFLSAPFVAAFSTVDRVTGHPVIQDHGAYRYSWSLFGFMVASLFYYLLGVFLYGRVLRVLWPGLDSRLNFLFAFSTGVPFYVLRRFAMSHAAEFAGCAFALWASVRLYRALATGGRARPWLLLAAVAAAANVAIRVNNLNALFLTHTAVLVLCVLGHPGAPRPAWRRVSNALLELTGWIAVACAPLALLNLHFYDAAYPTPAAMYGTELKGLGSTSLVEQALHGISLLPDLVPLVLSSEFGVLFTNPILVIGGACLITATARRCARRRDWAHLLTFGAVVVYFGVTTAVVLWWQTTATSYGYRYLFPLYPIALLGLVHLARVVRLQPPPGNAIMCKMVPAAVGALLCVSVISQSVFLATPALSTSPQVNVFGVYHSASARGYLSAIPGAMLRPYTWASLAARRYVGFAAGPLLMASPAARRLPADFRAGYRRMYAPVPSAVYLQLTLAFVAWVAGGYVVGFSSVRSPRSAWERRSVGRDPAAALLE